MKKLILLIILFSSSILSYADDCSKPADKVISKLSAHNKTSVTINYSADKADWAETCKKAILDRNNKITINMNQVNGTEIFKFSK